MADRFSLINKVVDEGKKKELKVEDEDEDFLDEGESFVLTIHFLIEGKSFELILPLIR